MISIEDVKNVRKGTVIFWEDPDEGACSSTIVVEKVWFLQPTQHLEIEDSNGRVLCAPLEELEIVTIH